MFTEGDNTSEVGEEIGEYFGFVKMSVSKTFNLNISDISHSGFFDIISELFEFGVTTKEISVPDV